MIVVVVIVHLSYPGIMTTKRVFVLLVYSLHSAVLNTDDIIIIIISIGIISIFTVTLRPSVFSLGLTVLYKYVH